MYFSLFIPVCLKKTETAFDKRTPSLKILIQFENFQIVGHTFCVLYTHTRCLLVLEIYGVSPFVLIFFIGHSHTKAVGHNS